MSLVEVRDRVGDLRQQIENVYLGLGLDEATERTFLQELRAMGVPIRQYVTGTGQTLHNTHEVNADCFRRGCPIHAPTDHSMKDFRTHWRGDRGLMERICPHGIGHPDPDHLAFTAEVRGKEAADVESVHGCDGCCRGAYRG